MTSGITRVLLSRLLTRAGDHAWEFALPLMLARLYPSSLRPTALFYVVSRLSVVLLMPGIGRWLDRTDRLTVARAAIALQFVGTILVLALITLASTEKSEHPDLSVILAFLGSGILVSLGANMMDVTIRGDWIPTLAVGSERGKANSRLRQIDLLTLIISPIATGWILSLDPSHGLYAKGFLCVLVLNMLSYVPEYFLIATVYASVPAIRERSAPTVSAGRSMLSEFQAGWDTFRRRPEVSVYIANSFLWFTALVPHGMLLTAALSVVYGIPETTLGWFRASGALAGILPTFFYNGLVRRFGALNTGIAFITLEALFLLLGTVGLAVHVMMIIPLGCIAASRIGLYGFTLAEIQIRQDAVPENERGAVGGVASSINYAMIVSIYFVALCLPRPQDFIVLAWMSTAAVATATGLMWWYRYSVTVPTAVRTTPPAGANL